MKKMLFVLIGLLSLTQIVQAEAPTRGVLREQKKEIKKEIVKEKKEIIQEKKIEDKEKSKNIIEQAKNAIKENIKKQIKGTLVTKNGTTLSVQKDQTTYTVITTDATQLKRKFGADSSLSEFSVNDELLIIGNKKKNTDGTVSRTEIEASYIRNMSIQRRFAVFNGEVSGITDKTITLQTKGRGTQTINILEKTLIKEKNVTILFSSLKVGDNLIIKGELWDRVSNTVDAGTILKLNKKSPSITPTVTSTPTED